MPASSDQSIAPDDLARYCERIGYRGPLAPTLECLRQLVTCHVGTIPFENIEVIAGRVPRLDPPPLHSKLVMRRRGGYCFEQNGYLRTILMAIGFEVSMREARVRTGVPAEMETPRTHLCLCVTIDEQELLVDVGFGALGPNAPLDFARTDAQSVGRASYRLQDEGETRLLQYSQADAWTDCYRICRGQPGAVDLMVGNWYVATHPKSMLAQNLLVSCIRDGRRIVLLNRKLTERADGERPHRTSILSARAEFADILADTFGLPLDSHDLDAIMRLIDADAGRMAIPGFA